MSEDYCECSPDIANTNAPLGGCTNCGRITKERAFKVSYSHWKEEEAEAHRELKMLHAVQANKQFLIDVIDFYSASFSLLWDDESLQTLKGVIENVDTAVDRKFNNLTEAAKKQQKLETDGSHLGITF